MKNRKGFTLIELLAVITVMGILLLVGVPTVMRVIENSRKDTAENNVKAFVREADKEMMSESIAGKEVEDGKYQITEEGNICLGVYDDGSDQCAGSQLLVEIDGVSPNGGEVTIKDKKVVTVTNVEISNRYANSSGDGYKITSTPKEKTMCTAVKEYSLAIGTEYTCEVGNGIIHNFYILSKDGSTVNMIMNKNLGGSVNWYDNIGGRNFNQCGPITAYENLEAQTNDWTKAKVIELSYKDINYGVNLEFFATPTEAFTRSRHPDCYERYESGGGIRARLPFKSEINAVTNKDFLYVNLAEYMSYDVIYDYWLHDTYASGDEWMASTVRGAQDVTKGSLVGVGIRPVISVLTSDLS